MKKLIFLLLTAFVGISMLSCQKEKIDPSSPVGRQWLVQDQYGDYFMDISEERVIKISDFPTKSLEAKKIFYNDDEFDPVESIEKTTDENGDPVWVIYYESGASDEFRDVNRNSAKVVLGSNGEDLEAKAVSKRIQMEYRYSPVSAPDLGVSVFWGTFNLSPTLYRTSVLNGTWYTADPEKDQVLCHHVLYDKDNHPSSYLFDGGGIYAWSEADPVQETLGGAWRMPTKEEAEELLSRCPWSLREFHFDDITMPEYLVEGALGFDWRWTTFPFAGYRSGSSKTQVGEEGYYWTSTPAGEGKAWALHITRDKKELVEMDRSLQLSIRPVWKK